MPRSAVFAAWAALCCLILSACATTSRYQDATPGHFEGVLLVMWVGEGNSSVGDGKFVFVPDPAKPLTFARSDPSRPGAVLRPGTMYTDGGSIPDIAQLFTGLSPWGYAPAYMIHDWIFTAHHCLEDGNTDPIYEPVRGIDFNQSATILIEAIRTLVAENKVDKNDVAVSLINAGVRSRIAERYWTQPGACARDAVSEKDLAAIAKVFSPNSQGIFRRANKLSPSAFTGSQVAEVLTRIEF